MVGSGLFALGLLVPLFQNQASAAIHDVQIEDFEFIPRNLVIAPGDTVVWYANAPDHTVTADDSSFDSSPLPDIVTIPGGAISRTRSPE